MVLEKHMPPQVFISYSHNDSQIANGLCNKIEEQGVDCWIAPRNITPGAGWANSIAQAIPTCKMLLLILSKDSNASSQVLREVEIAVQNNLVIIPARIEDIMPSGGMSYYLATMQWIDIKGKDIDTKISEIALRVKKVLNTIEESGSKEQLDNKLKSRDMGLEPIFKSGSKNPKFKRLTVIISASVLVIAVGLILFLFRDTLLSGKDSKDTLEQIVSDEPTNIPAPATSEASGSIQSEELQETIQYEDKIYTPEDLGMAADDVVEIKDSVLKDSIFSTLEDMGLSPQEDLTVSDMLSLECLIVVNSDDKQDFESRFYNDDYYSCLVDYTDYIKYCELSTAYMPDMSGIEFARNLKYLVIMGLGVRDVRQLGELTNLELIWLEDNKINDISQFAGLYNLKNLNLKNNLIDDIGSLGKLEKLYYLNLYDNNISDIEPLNSLYNLNELKLGKNSIVDLSPLQNMGYLNGINLDENKIEDISVFKYLKKVIWISMADNYIEDISPLSGSNDLLIVFLNNNNISDVSAFANHEDLEQMYIAGNPVGSLEPLLSCPELVILVVDADVRDSNMEIVGALGDNGCSVDGVAE